MVHMCRPKATCGSWFPPSTMWILGTEFRLSIKLGDKHFFSLKLTQMCGMSFT